VVVEVTKVVEVGIEELLLLLEPEVVVADVVVTPKFSWMQ